MWYKYSQKEKRKEYLKSLGVSDHVINFLEQVEINNNKQLKPMLAAIHKNPHITIEELNKLNLQKNINKLQEEISYLTQVFNYHQRNFDAVFLKWALAQFIKKFRTNQDFDNAAQYAKGNNNLDQLYDFYRVYKRENPNFDINSYSYDQINYLSEEWHKAMASKGQGITYLPLNPNNILHVFPNGYKLVVVDNENDLECEGSKKNMDHCVGTYFDKVQAGHAKILSLRDPANKPHVTIEASPDLTRIYQIKGKSNSEPKPEYKKMLKEYFSGKNIINDDPETITDQIYDLKYYNDSQVDDELTKILFSAKNNEYGLVEDVGIEPILDAVLYNAQYIKTYYLSDIANTVAQYAFKNDINLLKNIDKNAKKKNVVNRLELLKLKSICETTLDKFYDYYESPYAMPEREDFETDEEFEEAEENYYKDEDDYQKEAFKELIKSDPTTCFYYELNEYVDFYINKKEYKNLIEQLKE